MKCLLLLACFFAGTNFTDAAQFPWWFHTRQKPVLVQKQPENPAPRTVALNSSDQRAKAQSSPRDRQLKNPQQVPSWLAQLMARHSK